MGFTLATKMDISCIRGKTYDLQQYSFRNHTKEKADDAVLP